MNILGRILALDLEPDQYVIVGSCSLALHGIIPAIDIHDIDIAVDPTTYQKLYMRSEWREEAGAWSDRPVLRHELFDIGTGYGDWSFEELHKQAERISGMLVLPAAMQLIWLRQAGRAKDQSRIELLAEYLRQ